MSKKMTADEVIQKFGEICTDTDEFFGDPVEYVNELIEDAIKDGVDFAKVLKKLQQTAVADGGWTVSDMKLFVDLLKQHGYPARILITIE